MKTEDNIADICCHYEGDWKLELTKDKWDYKIIQIEQYKIESISLWNASLYLSSSFSKQLIEADIYLW